MLVESTPTLIARAERLEADALATITLAAPPDVAEELGLTLFADGGIVTSLVAAADVLALNRAIGFGLYTPATETEIDNILAVARAAGVRRLFVQVAPSARPANIGEMLASRGGQLYNRWTRLWRSTDPPLALAIDAGLELSRIGPTDGDSFARVVRTVYGMPTAMDRWLAATVGRPGWHHYGVTDGGEMIAAGALYAADSAAWIGLAATLPNHRGRGAQSALIAHRVSEAAAFGCTWVVTETAEDTTDRAAPSLRNMRRMGFTEAYRRPNYLFVLAR